MPLYLRPPRKQTHSWEIRGTYLGVRVERSTGASKRSVALAELRKLERAIETGSYPPARASQGEPTFLSAAVSYMQQGGERRYMGPLVSHFGETPLSAIDQDAIDQAGLALRPTVTGATRNRVIYTPVQAVLRHAGVKLAIRRPKGAKGKIRTDFLSLEDASAIAAAAHADLRPLLDFLLYTGCRLGEALALTWDDMRLEEGLAWVKTSKNGDPRTVLLRKDLRASLAPLRGTGRVFKFHQGGHLKWLLRRATLKACGIAAPERRPDGYETPPHRLRWVNFHTYCHTWASWMRRYGGADVQGLVATGRWRDARVAGRYAHVVAREEWARVEKLPKIG
jgi:integrase